MRISDWSSDVCSSDLDPLVARVGTPTGRELLRRPEHRRGTQARAGFARRDRPLRTRVGRRMQGTTVALARRARGSRLKRSLDGKERKKVRFPGAWTSVVQGKGV